MTTVKAFDTVKVTPQELFSMTYKTREMFSKEAIETMKENLPGAKFFERDGILFYVFPEKVNDTKVNVLDALKDYRMKPVGKLWKFGIVDTKTGELTLMFGGNFIARESEVPKFYRVASMIKSKRFGKNFITFAFRE